jgi:hypothetical protein
LNGFVFPRLPTSRYARQANLHATSFMVHLKAILTGVLLLLLLLLLQP